MSYVLKTKLANKSNYGNIRNLSNIKYIVVHYTANDGDTDEANANYFQNKLANPASAHYFVDDDSVTQSVPDNYVAYHCGTTGKYYHTCRNATSIGVELCDTIKNGKHDVSELTKNNAIELIKSLMKKYNIPIENVIRHYDVTHKLCPLFWVNDINDWNNFKNRLTDTTLVSNTVSDTIPTISYQVYTTKWLPLISNKDICNDYAGIENVGIKGIKVTLTKGYLKCKYHTLNGEWSDWIDLRNGFVSNKTIDAIQLWLNDVGAGYHVKYNVSRLGSTSYLGEVTDLSNYAGIYGKTIDKLQIRITKD